ncbi:DUF2309 domain-containing protein [Daejeonella sp.]|uniref:YbcC family protein n=1 Tax=Daejeonella sp. TaxID=2805397 RepID=UPI0030BEE9A2
MTETGTLDTLETSEQINYLPVQDYDVNHTLHELKHFLPSQTPLKDFIHHNSLHAYQHMKFYDAIFKASKTFGYQVTLQLKEFRQMYKDGRIREDILDKAVIERKPEESLEEWKRNLLDKEYDLHNSARIGQLRKEWNKQYKLDLSFFVNPLLFRLLNSYLDQGISLWNFPLENAGFLASVRELERNGISSFFQTDRARKLIADENITISALLDMVVGDPRYYEQYLFDQQFGHPGWSGMVATVEDQPHTLLDNRAISLKDLITLELIMEIDVLENQLDNWKPLASNILVQPLDLFADVQQTETNEVLMIWQDAFEWSYYDGVLAGIEADRKRERPKTEGKSFQALFCIDERECSIRRHIENVDKNCETLGTPGFFGVEFYFQPENGKFYDKLCPAPVTPKYLIKESDVLEKRKHELLYTKLSHTFFIGSLISLTLGFFAFFRLILNLFQPKMSPAISNAFAHMGKGSRLTIENANGETENGLQVGFTVTEMGTRVEGHLRGIGLIRDFSKLIYVIGHGSSSANNPHHGAHDCGACSGRPGSVNARVFAFMANHQTVRQILAEHGINIPEEVQFLGGLHDTAADQIQFFDDDILTPVNFEAHRVNKQSFERALDLNAKERSRRFASIKTKMTIGKVRRAILDRSVSLFEPRPELGHGTNTLCIVGSRNLTKGVYLDRRAFLNSYDYRTDPEGKLLSGVMRPLGPVCGGINLEYYFSRVDNYRLGAGTKLPHNVMGLIGVANSSDGDLRPGLPVQMIEVHDPVRLLIIVEHYPEVVLKTIQDVPEMYEWFINEWVHLVAINPETHKFHRFKEGEFVPYQPLKKTTEIIEDFNGFIERAPEMETNNIPDATKENLPVYLLD